MLDRKAIELVLIILLIVGALLANLAFDMRETDRSFGVFLGVVGALYALSQANRKFAAPLNGWSWRRFGNLWPWTVIGLV
jgi:hypothetical protein